MTSLRRRSPAPGAHSSSPDVAAILEAADKVPSPVSGNPALVVLIGLPGSGKSTFARQLAPRIDAVVLESDAMRQRLFAKPTYSSAESRRLFTALHAATSQLLASGRSVIFDATSLREADRRPLYAIAQTAGCALHLLRFSADRPVISERLAARAAGVDSNDNSTAGLTVHLRMQEREQKPDRDYWDIDTTDPRHVDALLKRVVEACLTRRGRVTGGVN